MTKALKSVDASLIILCCLAVLIGSYRASAQVLYGSITGVVQDASGAAVPTAEVTAVNEATGQSRRAVTTDDGTYLLADLPAGAYTVTIVAPGFKTWRANNAQVNIAVVTRQNVQLQVGQQAETVTVESSVGAIQTDTADVHVTLSSQQVTQLPLPGYRNYQTLLNLVPGAAPVGYQNSVGLSPGRALTTNINGATSAANNTRLDGALNMRASLPSQSMYVPPAESIETVNVATNSFDAEQGFAGGAAINVITKSGTNQFHGVLFEHHTNGRLTARNVFNLSSAGPKDTLNTYGGTFGGPIRKNKLFFFGSWEGMKERSNYTSLVTIPTDAQRAGNFAGLSTIYDPNTGNPNGTGRTPFPNNQIFDSRISQIAKQMQSLLPEPNLPGNTSNYFDSAPVRFNRDNFDAKINWNASSKSTFWAKYSAMKALVTSQFSLGKAGGVGMINGGGAGTGDVLQQIGALGGVHTFSPTFLVDFTVAVSRDPATGIGPDSDIAYGRDVLHIPGTNGPNSYYNGIPRFVVSGYETMGDAEVYLPKILRDTYFVYSANAGWTKGKHDMRFGVDLARFRENDWVNQGGGGGKGSFTFDGSVTLPGTGSPSQFNNYAAFLLGLPQNVARAVEPYWQTPRALLEGFYFRDRWQATQKLTVSLGVRWEYAPIMTFSQFGMVRFDPDSGNVLIGGRGSVPYNTGTTTSKKMFAPRIGLAYRIGSKSVIRAGYGISFDPTAITASQAAYPITVQQSWAGNTAYIPYGPIEKGIPDVPVPDISSGVVPLPTPTSTTSLPPGPYKRGYIESYNFTIERELPGRFVASVGYVGTHTIRGRVGFNINAANPGGGNNGRPLASKGFLVNETFTQPIGAASYNSLQLSANRKVSSGLHMSLAYTFSKAIDNSSTCWNCPSGLLFYDAANFGRNRALSAFDRSQNFRVSWLAELPFGAGKRWAQNGIGRHVLGGWQLNGIFGAYTGTPFTVTASAASLNAPGQSQTANQVTPTVARLGGIGSSSPYYDPKAFAPVTAAATYGNSGRNILRGPSLVNADVSLFRNFRVKERWGIQLRAESYNISNTPHFNNPSSNVSSGGFMTITSAYTRGDNVEGGERQFRLALKVNF